MSAADCQRLTIRVELESRHAPKLVLMNACCQCAFTFELHKAWLDAADENISTSRHNISKHTPPM